MKNRGQEIFLVKKTRKVLSSIQFATVEEVIQYYLCLRESKPSTSLKNLVCCPNKGSTFTPKCPDSGENCCVISKLKVSWELGGYRTRDIQCVLRSEGDLSDFSLSSECLESVTSESNDDSHEEEQSLLLPKDVLKRTALTAVGEGLSINLHTSIISSVIAISGGEINKFVVSKSSSLRAVDKVINSEAQKIRQYIKDLTDSKYKLISVHFDGKIFKEYTDKVSVTRERLAVLVKVNGKTELLGIPHIESSSGENQFKAVYNLLDSFGLSHHIQRICFDTTASNTGKDQGVITRMADKLGRPLLFLACRHHILERHITHFTRYIPVVKRLV
nr:uncharacterized protein LOC124814075 [Hydra vulgaris]